MNDNQGIRNDDDYYYYCYCCCLKMHTKSIELPEIELQPCCVLVIKAKINTIVPKISIKLLKLLMILSFTRRAHIDDFISADDDVIAIAISS